jgi:putative nucleotidyltransferase with HDIG domain
VQQTAIRQWVHPCSLPIPTARMPFVKRFERIGSLQCCTVTVPVSLVGVVLVGLLIATHARRDRWGPGPFKMMLSSSVVLAMLMLTFPKNDAVVPATLMAALTGLMLVRAQEGWASWWTNLIGLGAVLIGGFLVQVALWALHFSQMPIFRPIGQSLLEQGLYSLIFAIQVVLTERIHARFGHTPSARALIVPLGMATLIDLLVGMLVFGEAFLPALALRGSFMAIAMPMLMLYVAWVERGRPESSPEREAYTTLLRTVEVLSQRSSHELWPDLLASAVRVVPGAQAGSLWVRSDGNLRMMAQHGFDDRLLGTEVSQARFLDWYGDPQGWAYREPRISTGAALQLQGQESRKGLEGSAQLEQEGRVQDIRANLCLPIWVGDELLAYLNLDAFTSEHAFDDASIEIARQYALQTTALLTANRERAALEARLHELEVLEEISDELRTARDRDEIARRVTRKLIELLESENACVSLITEDGQVLRVLVKHGIFQRLGIESVPRGSGISWAALEAREVIVSDNVLHEAQLYNPNCVPNDSNTQLTAPMFDAAGAPLGVLISSRSVDRPYTELDQRVIRVIANVTANALERIRATLALEVRLNETQRLLDLSQMLEHTSENAIELALEHIRQMSLADLAVVTALDGDAHRVMMMAGEPTPALRTMFEHGLPRSFVEQLGLLTSGFELLESDSTPMADVLRSMGIKALLSVPIVTDERRLGLTLFRFDLAQGWMALDLSLLQAAAQMLGAVISRTERVSNLETAYDGALRAIGVALEARDRETAGHTDRVTNLADRIGLELGLNDVQRRNLRWGAYLHDIGKFQIPDAILLKPGKLNPDERTVIETHASLGYDLTRNLAFLPEATRLVVRHHHERWDGRGYPDRLRSETIPLEARIFALCDVFDALTSHRPYKSAMPVQQALEVVRDGVGAGQFDPRIFAVFERVVVLEHGLERSWVVAPTMAPVPVGD